MKPTDFFKTLNYKINKYDKTVTNPFDGIKQPYTLIWIEDGKDSTMQQHPEDP